jgi:hypothetical protein
MRVPRLLKALLVMVALVVLGALPVGAAETLVLSCTVCTTVVATGGGLPANADVQVTMNDVTTGQEVVKPVPVQTDAQGKFVKKVAVDLTKHPSLESSVWTNNGQVLVIAAHSRFNSPCKPKPGQKKLAFTGSHTPELLGGGLGLLAAGMLLLYTSRRRVTT